MGFSKQEYWSECHALLQGTFRPVALKSSALAGEFFIASTTGEDPSPFQPLLILISEGLFLKPNFHSPYLTESEISPRERKLLRSLDLQATVTLLSTLAHSGISATNYFLYLFRLVFFLSLSFILPLLLFPPLTSLLLLLLLFCFILLLHLLFLVLSVHMLSGAQKGVGHLFYFGLFLINRDRQIQWFSSSAYSGWR